MTERTYRIGEAARLLDLEGYVLRFWETEFPQLAPARTPKGQRVYSEADLALLRRIRELLHEQGMTIEGARRVLAGEVQAPFLLSGTALGTGPTHSVFPPAQPVAPVQAVQAATPVQGFLLTCPQQAQTQKEVPALVQTGSRAGVRTGGATVSGSDMVPGLAADSTFAPVPGPAAAPSAGASQPCRTLLSQIEHELLFLRQLLRQPD